MTIIEIYRWREKILLKLQICLRGEKNGKKGEVGEVIEIKELFNY